MNCTKIKYVSDLSYVHREEIATSENAKEILKSYSATEKIPFRFLELEGHEKEHDAIILAGEPALYPWKRGQKVETSFIQGLVFHLEFLRELRSRGIDNSKYQNILLHDTIIPVKTGKYFAEKDDNVYKGIVSEDLYKEYGDYVIEKYSLV